MQNATDHRTAKGCDANTQILCGRQAGIKKAGEFVVHINMQPNNRTMKDV